MSHRVSFVSKRELSFIFIVISTWLMAIILVGFSIGRFHTLNKEHENAIKAGVGCHKIIDSFTGKTEWIYGCLVCASNAVVINNKEED